MRGIRYRRPRPHTESSAHAHALARHALPHPHLRGAARGRRRDEREARGLGPPAARLRKADLHRPPRPARDHPGRDRRGGRARGARDGERAAVRVRGRVRGRGRDAPAGHREREARDGGCRAPGARRDDPQRVEDAAVLRQRPGGDDRREPPAPLSLSRHPARRDAAPPAPPQPPRAGDPRGTPRERVRRGRDAQPHQVDPRGRPRLHRPEPPPAGHGVRPAPEPAAAQAAADGRRHRPLLPDRPLLPRRGPARRPPAGVHAARPRDELRRRGDGHGVHRADGDRGHAGDDPGAPDPRRPVPGVRVRRGDGALRLGQAGHPVRDGAGRPRPGARRRRRRARVGLPRVRRDARLGRPGQGDRRAGAGRRHATRDRRADGAREAVRRQGPRQPRRPGGRRAPRPDREVPRPRRRRQRSASAPARARATSSSSSPTPST